MRHDVCDGYCIMRVRLAVTARGIPLSFCDDAGDFVNNKTDIIKSSCKIRAMNRYFLVPIVAYRFDVRLRLLARTLLHRLGPRGFLPD